MGKEKKGGKRMNKKQLAEKLEGFFQTQPGKTFSFKEIFRTLHLDTHPLKMLAIDIMEEMTWDDFLVKVDVADHRLNGAAVRSAYLCLHWLSPFLSAVGMT